VSLFEFAIIPSDGSKTPQERFEEFHRANPSVYQELRRLALILKNRGHKRIGISMLFEQMRWQWYATTTDVTGFKLNNNYRAYYARMLMENEEGLDGFFTIRESK